MGTSVKGGVAEVSSSEDRGRTVTSRVLAILAAFTPARTQLTLAQICRLTGLRHSTAHRLVAELTAWGAMERLPGGAYVIGLRLWELGTLNPRGLPLRFHAMPIMEDLHAATHEHVQLAVLDGTDALIVERISTTNAVPVASPVGGRMPLHATASGKVLLAHAGEDLFTETVRAGLSRFTPSTTTDPARLRAALADCRRTGVAVVREEMSPGVYSVATPVVDANHRVVAALAVVSADPATHQLSPAVVLAGRGISRSLRLGGQSASA
ncbi:IclR family transcriptional regulator [Streptomyces griseiscabiei]|uniref:IclR family transcriptional regulator n=1 Tax=Streptomyces griseiscabiei TaxID=2993540 RepID=A0ABU4LGI7_9ACTN|nr:IclR family transcriptional regulator [Streptomyces griseiscabiei]MBZ3900392.1 IclR family transcriptional regulator [Streptomyces griseiscabiei]MDX2914560.1 IclR family transcriptional regulator [Streptomyces griseiscabiei]